MNNRQITQEFHDEMDGASTQEIKGLRDLCHEGSFAREAGVEFVTAVDTVCEERGISEGS